MRDDWSPITIPGISGVRYLLFNLVNLLSIEHTDLNAQTDEVMFRVQYLYLALSAYNTFVKQRTVSLSARNRLAS